MAECLRNIANLFTIDINLLGKYAEMICKSENIVKVGTSFVMEFDEGRMLSQMLFCP